MSDKLTFSVSKLVQELKKSVEAKYKKGVLRLFSQHAASPMKGAYLEY